MRKLGTGKLRPKEWNKQNQIPKSVVTSYLAKQIIQRLEHGL